MAEITSCRKTDSAQDIHKAKSFWRIYESARFSYTKGVPGAFKAILGLGQYLLECGLEETP
jgi:hypothetical protein